MPEASVSVAQHIERMRALQAGWADPDSDRFAALFTEDAEFEDVVYGNKVRGRAAIRAYHARVAKHARGMRVEISACEATLTTGVCEWRLFHLYSGNFDGVNCTDAKIDIRGLSVYEFADGLIHRARDYWNYMEMIRAVGVLPRELRPLCSEAAGR